MAKFVFNLESVLRARKADERARLLALAAVQREQAALEDELRRIHNTIQIEREELRQGLVGNEVDLRAARMQAASTVRLEGQARRVVQGIAAMQPRLEAARQALVEAMTRRKAVEKLREARYEEWITDSKRREATILDEVGLASAARIAREEDESNADRAEDQRSPQATPETPNPITPEPAEAA